MVRSLRIIGACVAFIASTTSALSLSTPPARSVDSTIGTGAFVASNVRRDAFVMMPTGQKAPLKTGGPAVLDRPVAERKQTKEPTKEKNNSGGSGWEVRIFNDGTNTREHVARTLVQTTGLSEVAAYQAMMQAHQDGMSAVGTWIYEKAEMYRDALMKNGIVCDMVPVEGDR